MLKYLTNELQGIGQIMNTISSKFGRYRSRDNSRINSSKAEEKRSCWAIVTIDGFELDAKIIHRGWGEFEILEDNCEGNSGRIRRGSL